MTEMRETQPGATAGVPRQAARREAAEPTGWVGWIVFASVMMIMVGTFHAIQGLVALFNDEYYLVGKNGLVVEFDYTGWGWVHLIAGIVVVGAGFALMSGRTWARTVAILLAGVSAVVNIAFLAAFPIWSAIVIALDVLVIYAVAVHGGEAREVSREVY